ncbi:MAG TPA: stage II sporulation protein M [Gemmatimonadaceae bacterium]|nr:stage II sporulation protein M [Gemmatimonadaceae bacterium]
MAQSPPSLEQHVEIETPEQVAFSYTVAGIGSRAGAALIDGAICVATYAALYWLVHWAVRRAGGVVPDAGGSTWASVVLIVGQFAVFWGYYVLFEGLRDGQTPGKRMLGLRVVRDGGYALDFAASAARNLVRVVDMQPAIVYGVGLVSAAASPQGKRLGDYVAGTIVVRERPVTLAEPVAEGSPRAGEGVRPLATLLTDEEFAVLERFRERRSALDETRVAVLTARLAERFRDRAPELAAEARGDAAFIARLLERERDARARGVAARSTSGAGRERHALVAAGAARWAAFAHLLADAQRRGLESMSEEEVSDFVTRYRELATDLARLRTASRGSETDAVYSLSRLVAGGHNLLYRGRRVRPAALGRYLMVTVPAEIRRAWRPILLAAVLLFVPAFAGFEATRRSPEATLELVPRGLIDRAETGVVRRAGGGGYLPEEEASLRGPLLASAITTNNLRVTFTAFAGGATAGVLTVFSLVLNGVAAIGAPMGLWARLGILDQILGFVAPHGVLELAAICIAGGGGFLLAAGILLPGALTRREALARQGRRALHLIAGATLLLLVAGPIEGYVSPLVWPLAWKAAVSAATTVGLVAWLWAPFGRARAPRAP